MRLCGCQPGQYPTSGCEVILPPVVLSPVILPPVMRLSYVWSSGCLVSSWEAILSPVRRLSSLRSSCLRSSCVHRHLGTSSTTSFAHHRYLDHLWAPSNVTDILCSSVSLFHCFILFFCSTSWVSSVHHHHRSCRPSPCRRRPLTRIPREAHIYDRERYAADCELSRVPGRTCVLRR